MHRHSVPLAPPRNTKKPGSHRRRPRAAKPTLRFEPLEERRLLATITVNTADDIVDLNDGRTSLREAIFAANLVEGPDEIRFDFGHDGSATIRLTAGEIKITDDLTITGTGSNLLTIDASGNDPTPDEKLGDGSRIFHIDDGDANHLLHVAISALRLTGGDVLGAGGAILSRENLRIHDSIIEGNGAAQQGGAIAQSGGRLDSVGNLFRENRANNGGGIQVGAGELHVASTTFTSNSAAYGGAIDLRDSNATIGSTTLDLNSAQHGGAIYISNQASRAVTINDSTIAENEAAANGGGIFSLDGILTISKSVVRANEAQLGGGLFLGDAATIVSSSVADNRADFEGGGIFVEYGDILIQGSHLEGNFAARNGGAISIAYGGNVSVTHSEIARNRADDSGGGISSLGELSIVDSTLHENLAMFAGGAIASSNLEMVNSTVSDNSATRQGGGLLLKRGNYSVRHSTITQNWVADFEQPINFGAGIFVIAGMLELSHSILAGNFGAIGPDLTGLVGATFHVSHSLIGRNDNSGLAEAPVGSPDANGNLIGGPAGGFLHPRLGPLQNNGGPVPTHALLSESPAIDAGDPAALPGTDGVPEFDQRGTPFSRRFGGRIDLGAYERHQIQLPILVVDTLEDELDGDYSPGDLSLREAISLTNGALGADTIRFAPHLTANGPVTLHLTRGELIIRDELTIEGPGQHLLTIDAAPSDPTPDVKNGDGSRVFQVNDGDFASQITVTISGLTLTGGDTAQDGGAIMSRENLSIVGATLRDNAAQWEGGAISGGSVSIVDSTLSDNRAESGGAVAGLSVTVNESALLRNLARTSGGAIFVQGRQLAVERSTIADNVSLGAGGGICAGNVMLTSSEVTGNRAVDGAGIYAMRGEIQVVRSLIAGNSASGSGGGIYAKSGSMITATSLRGNSAGEDGGAVYVETSNHIIRELTIHNNAAKRGGGIFNLDARLFLFEVTFSANAAAGGGGALWNETRMVGPNFSRLTNVTLSANSAAKRGGGIHNEAGLVQVRFSTITRNIAPEGAGSAIAATAGGRSRTEVESSIIAGNTRSDLDDIGEGATSFVSLGYNLIGSGSGVISFNHAGDQTSIADPRLSPLAPHGGATFTHRPLPASPAIDAGNPEAMPNGPGAVPPYDQRGESYTRVADGDGDGIARIDIGAVELGKFEANGPLLPGDFNLDGIVDAADYSVWRSAMDRQVAPYTGADANGDAIVDDLDYLIWKRNYGVSQSVSISAPAPVGVERTVDRAFAELEAHAPASHSERSLPMTREPNHLAPSGIESSSIDVGNFDASRFSPRVPLDALVPHIRATQTHGRPARPGTRESVADDRRIELIAALASNSYADDEIALASRDPVADEDATLADAAFDGFALLGNVWD